MFGTGQALAGSSHFLECPRELATPVPGCTSREERHDRYVAQRNVLFGISTDSEGSSRLDTPPLIPGDDGYDWGGSSIERAGFPGFPRVLQYGGDDLLIPNTSGVQEGGESSGRSSPFDVTRTPPEGGGTPLRNSPPPSPRSESTRLNSSHSGESRMPSSA